MRGSAASVGIIHVFVVLNLSVLHDNASIDARSKVGAEDSVFGQGTKCSYMERVGTCRGSRVFCEVTYYTRYYETLRH